MNSPRVRFPVFALMMCAPPIRELILHFACLPLQGQNVIILLRSELEAKAGDLSEARERINLLEQNSLQNVSWIADISEKMATAGPQLTAAVEAQARLHRSIRDAEDRYLLLMTDLEREKALGKTRLRELEEERAT